MNKAQKSLPPEIVIFEEPLPKQQDGVGELIEPMNLAIDGQCNTDTARYVTANDVPAGHDKDFNSRWVVITVGDEVLHGVRYSSAGGQVAALHLKPFPETFLTFMRLLQIGGQVGEYPIRHVEGSNAEIRKVIRVLPAGIETGLYYVLIFPLQLQQMVRWVFVSILFAARNLYRHDCPRFDCEIVA